MQRKTEWTCENEDCKYEVVYKESEYCPRCGKEKGYSYRPARNPDGVVKWD